MDFELKGTVTSGNVDSDIPDWYNFINYNVSEQIVSTSNPRTTHIDMFYRYDLDNNDVSGKYTMYLKYTIATT